MKENKKQAEPVEEKPTEIEEHNDNLSEVDGFFCIFYPRQHYQHAASVFKFISTIQILIQSH